MEIEEKYRVPWREELSANLRGLWMVGQSAPFVAIAQLIVALISGLAPAIIIFQTGELISNVTAALDLGVDSAPAMGARRALIILAGAVVVTQLMGPVNEALRFALERRFQAYLSRRVMTGVSDLPGMAYFEDPDFRDKLEVTSWIGWMPVQSVNQFLQGIQNVFSLVAMITVVAAKFAPWAPLVIVLSALPAGIAGWHYTSVVGMVQWRYSPEIRRATYYKDLALTLEPAKEIRISGLKDWVVGRQGSHWLAGKQEVWNKQRRTMLATLFLTLFANIVVALVFFSALRSTAIGRLDIGNFAAASMAMVGTSSGLIALFQSAASIRRNNYWLPNALRIMKLAKTDPRLDVSGTRPARELPRTGISFENVSFHYAGTDRRIIDQLDLWIPSGSSIALVGENGAGKTTLIKLLCRFFDPTEGRILLDGVDIREFDLADLRTRLAVIFQDFVHYKLPASDNVGFGAIDRREDKALLEEAARRVGVLEKIESLPDGWETPLSREFEGVDLSGGEWQRVALARAMMAQIGRGSDILILDEPTASLDVRLEHELYEHFAELSRGQTTLLVSHRFSTVRMAERIVFMEDGRIVEDGSHEQLMDRRGRYAELYEIQASHYRATGVLE
ncbi:MAG: ABC transporter ATP-binding protein/permease [Actinobacteria bacterium]|nr:ABC transporter ATP-binding protein/permease [Actinomycetota bacterium]